jgi:cobalt-zinc-cadmium efflux system outer membrane protein
LQSRSLASPELKAFLEKNLSSAPPAWPLSSWSFEQLALAAYFYHPGLEVTRAQWRSAEAAALTAGGRPNPTVTVTPGFNSDAASGVTPWMPALSFDIPLETAHKRDFRIAVAQSLAQSSRFNISTAAWQVRSNLRVALLNFIAAQRRERLLEAAQQNQEKIITSLKQNVAAGAIAGNEVRPALIIANKAALDLFDAKRQQEEARAHIAEAIGVPVKALEKLQLTYNLDAKVSLPKNLLKAQEIALKSRGDILSALADYAAAESQLQLEIAKQYPDIHISPNYQWDQGESKWALGVTVELPLLNRNQGPIAEAKARREEIAAKFLALQAKVLSEVELAFANLRASREQLRSVDKLLAVQRQQLNSIQSQQKAGALTQLDTLTAQTEINAADLSRLDSQIKIQQAIGTLEDALQKPLTSEAMLASPDVSPSARLYSPSEPKHASTKTKSKR